MTDSAPATATATPAENSTERPPSTRTDVAEGHATLDEARSEVAFETLGEWVDETQNRLPPDVLFDVLKNQRRRLVLQFLRESEGTVRIGTLAEHIAAFENDVSPRSLNAQQRKRVYIGLYQCHLPKMADVDVIEFNQARGIIDLGPHGDELFAYLDADAELPASPRPYFALTVGGGLMFLSASLFLPGWFGTLVVGAILIGIASMAIIRSTDG